MLIAPCPFSAPNLVPKQRAASDPPGGTLVWWGGRVVVREQRREAVSAVHCCSEEYMLPTCKTYPTKAVNTAIATNKHAYDLFSLGGPCTRLFAIRVARHL